MSDISIVNEWLRHSQNDLIVACHSLGVDEIIAKIALDKAQQANDFCITKIRP